MRAGSDAIAVGMKTVLADDPLLTVRDAEPPRIRPLRVVFSRAGRLPLDSRLAQGVDQAPVLVFAEAPDEAHATRLRALGVDVVQADLTGALRELKKRGVQFVAGRRRRIAGVIAGRRRGCRSTRNFRVAG